jgi:hypothetical protein
VKLPHSVALARIGWYLTARISSLHGPGQSGACLLYWLTQASRRAATDTNRRYLGALSNVAIGILPINRPARLELKPRAAGRRARGENESMPPSILKRNNSKDLVLEVMGLFCT